MSKGPSCSVGFRDDLITLRQTTCSWFPATTLLWALESALKSQRGQSSRAHQMAHPFNFEAACAWQGSRYRVRLKVRIWILPLSFRALRSVSPLLMPVPRLHISLTELAHTHTHIYMQIMLNKPDLSDLSTTLVSICLVPAAMGISCHTLSLEMHIKLIIWECNLSVND